MLKTLRRWLYRDSDTGWFMSKDKFDKRDPKTTQRERVIPNEKLGDVIEQMKDERDA